MFHLVFDAHITLGAYAWSAIWSNLELFIGITAANLALSRYIYLYIRHGKNSQNSQLSSSYANNRTQYGNNSALRPEGLEYQSTLIASGRVPSISKSDASEIPLKEGIRKKTEFWVSDGKS